MKILLDECLPVDFRHSFPGREAHSVEWAGFKGKKNGELLQAAEGGGYQVLVTVDHGIPRQQTMMGIHAHALDPTRSKSLARITPEKRYAVTEPAILPEPNLPVS